MLVRFGSRRWAKFWQFREVRVSGGGTFFLAKEY